MPESEIGRFRQEQTLREQAAQQGLHAMAVVASHATITARMERQAECLLKKLQEGKHDEVTILMEMSTWGLEEGMCRTTIAL